MRSTHRRRLLAGLVFVGLAPIEALAQSHSNARLYGIAPAGGASPGNSSSSASSSPPLPASSTAPTTPSAPAAPLPDCVLNTVDLISGFKLSARVETGNVINGFELLAALPVAALKLTSLKKTDASDQVMLKIVCQLQDGAPDGVAIASFGIHIPELTGAAAGAAVVSLGSPSLKIGAGSLKHDPVGGVAGTYYSYDTLAADFPATAVRQGGALNLQAADGAGGAGKVEIAYELPRLGPVFAAAKSRLDKLKSDAIAGLCKIPVESSYSGKFCTTAAIEVIGLRRNCWELQALHDFRDWMRSDSSRAWEADEYDRRAPVGVYNISRRPDARRVWLNFYFAGVLPAAALWRFGFSHLARLVYRITCNQVLRLADC